MTIQSMTGFARSEGRIDDPAQAAKWVWELRSVNAKGLDIRLRLPNGFESQEVEFRKAISSAITRGSIQASLRYEREGAAEVPVVNRDALEAVIRTVEDLRKRLDSPPPAAEAILSVKGVMEMVGPEEDENALDARNRVVIAGLGAALADLVAARAGEGEAIVRVLGGHVEEIARLTAAVEDDPSRSPEAIRERLTAQLAPLVEDAGRLDPQRLHQEAAILATRADLREEIDRLLAHIEAARGLLASTGPVGRKLDFLAQEFNRECNTICSKSNAASVTRLGLEMKVVIDQFREQIQNLE